MEKLIRKLYVLNFFTSKFYMLSYLCLCTSLAYILSNSILVYSLFSGLYLMSMGLGAFLANKIQIKSDNVLLIILLNGAMGLYLVNPGVTGLIYMNEYLYFLLRNTGTDYLPVAFITGLILTALLGLFSGIELPLFSRLIEEKNINDQSKITRVLSIDYIGTCFGVLLFHFYLYPFHGLIRTIFYGQCILGLIVIFLLFSFGYRWRILLCFTLPFLVFCILGLMFQEEFLNTLNHLSY